MRAAHLKNPTNRSNSHLFHMSPNDASEMFLPGKTLQSYMTMQLFKYQILLPWWWFYVWFLQEFSVELWIFKNRYFWSTRSNLLRMWTRPWCGPMRPSVLTKSRLVSWRFFYSFEFAKIIHFWPKRSILPRMWTRPWCGPPDDPNASFWLG